jgi:hypothetical protein
MPIQVRHNGEKLNDFLNCDTVSEARALDLPMKGRAPALPCGSLTGFSFSGRRLKENLKTNRAAMRILKIKPAINQTLPDLSVFNFSLSAGSRLPGAYGLTGYP